MLKLGFSEFVCKDWDEYIRKAVKFGQSRADLIGFSGRVDRSSFVFDTQFFVRALERKYFEVSSIN